MDTEVYSTEIKLKLKPVLTAGYPYCKVRIGNEVIYDSYLKDSTDISYKKEFDKSTQFLEIHFNNKTDADSTESTDKAIIIESIEINNFKSKKFIWEGIYEPKYPKIWYLEQVKKGTTPSKQLKNCSYLGWNGVYRLEFDVPAYTWIHKVLDFGMIYPG